MGLSQRRSEGDIFVALRADGRAREALLGVGVRAGLGQELHAKRDDLVLAAFIALLVLPDPIPQPAFEQDRVALVQVCGTGLGLVAEDYDVDEAGLVLSAVVAALDAVVHR